VRTLAEYIAFFIGENMDNELQLQTGAYKTTFVGTEILRESTPQEWEKYGTILKMVDEAKQWAIGDWLCDGKRHYGDGLYKKASLILGIDERTLEGLKQIADRFQITLRNVNLLWSHHKEVASLKQIDRSDDKDWKLSKEKDVEKIQELLKKAERESLSVRALRDVVQEHKANQSREIALANEPDKYRIFYADPPWKYGNEQHGEFGVEQETVLESHYPTMTIKELSDLPINKITATDAVLFLWVTSPFLELCFPMITAWGFKYKTSMVWDKVKHNVGNYVSVRHEFLLICTRGACTPDNVKLFDSVQTIERTEHSRKPEEFREIIDTIYTHGKRIELFRRGDAPAGWDTWGNEA